MLYYHVIHFCIITFCQEINDLFGKANGNDVKIGPWFRLIKDNFLSKIWRNLESIENINDNEVHHMGEVE